MGLLSMEQEKIAAIKSQDIKKFFHNYLESIGETGDIGFAKFERIYDALIPVQQEKLRLITGRRFEMLLDSGSFISIGISYRDPVIDFIDSKDKQEVDYQRWNRYALEYHRLNQILNRVSRLIATRFDGIALSATIGGVIEKVNHVSDYFGMVISHRVVAEKSGIGWRGKNQLTIHDKFSCAIRFASIIVPFSLTWGEESESRCGTCIACEEACSFIRNRDILPDFRENCRRYILFLKSQGIEKDICGKCIKACYQNSNFHNIFSLPS